MNLKEIGSEGIGWIYPPHDRVHWQAYREIDVNIHAFLTRTV
jgi:hypothetical protein